MGIGMVLSLLAGRVFRALHFLQVQAKEPLTGRKCLTRMTWRPKQAGQRS